jgi:ankyrin repeat protein
LKKQIFKSNIEIDDPIDSYSMHTLLHDAVIFNREEIFEFLLQQGANLMVRDANGYTALLKAASLGRTQMVKRLIEKGVDPRHCDPYGNTARDKAKLYNPVSTRSLIGRSPSACESAAASRPGLTIDWQVEL